MIEMRRFALNRIACPSLGVEDSLRLTADLGLAKVELRNDLPGRDVTDGLPASKIAALEDLERLLGVAATIRCRALVLCANDDARDHRDHQPRVSETVDALRSFDPAFRKRGILGYVEPLGFPESSFSSVIVVMEAVKDCGSTCYRILDDTSTTSWGPTCTLTSARSTTFRTWALFMYQVSTRPFPRTTTATSTAASPRRRTEPPVGGAHLAAREPGICG